MTACRDDRGDIVLGWLTKLTLVLGLVGVVGFDAISLTLGKLEAADAAETAAREAMFTYRDGKDVQLAYESALGAIPADGSVVLDPADFTVHSDGSVTVSVTHTASTFLVEKVSAASDWAVSSATATASLGG